MSRVPFVHLDGRGIRIVSKRGERVINPNEELVIRGEGMPRRGRAKGDKGDLYVRFEVEMPGASWAARSKPEVSGGLSVVPAVMDGADHQGMTVELPPPLPEMSPLPEVVDERMLSSTR